jgi:hypothetical protein
MDYEKELERILEDACVPVRFSIMGENDGGYYSTTERCIVLNVFYQAQDKIICLVHELQHAKCQMDGCSCIDNLNDHTLGEYHAMMAEIKYAYESNDEYMVAMSVHCTRWNAELFSDKAHSEAARLCMKSDSWLKLLELQEQLGATVV